LVQFKQSTATYLFDLASAVGAAQEDRTVAAWAVRGGKRFRALEREAAATPGIFYFAQLLYEDDTAYPTTIESGLLRHTELCVESFRNRFPAECLGLRPAPGDPQKTSAWC
jgi:hypothetical protein